MANARHTASILKDADLRTFPEHGPLSVMAELVGALGDLLAKIER